MARYSLETVKEIWNDETGECWSIGPDRDGLNMLEIRYKTSDGAHGSSLSFTREQAVLVAEALSALLATQDGDGD